MEMTSTEQLERLFDAALSRPLEKRAEFLQGIADSGMRQELERLVRAADRRVFTFPDEPPRAMAHIGGYRLVETLGSGGSATVYAGQHAVHDRVDAIKVFRLSNPFDQSLRRLRREARTLARLDHPHVARIYDAGHATTPEGPVAFCVLELVEHALPITTYAAHVQESVDERVSLLLQAARGVAHAHRQNVIHLDLKPTNVLVDLQGQVKIVDFGIGRIVHEQRTTETLESRGIHGTLAYMAPEQARTEQHPVDERADVFALGVLLCELVTSRHPFAETDEGWTAQLRRMQRDDADPRTDVLDRLPGALRAITQRALQWDPKMRYLDATALANDLAAYLKNEPIDARAPSLRERSVRLLRKRGLAVTSTCVLLVSVALFVMTMLHPGGSFGAIPTLTVTALSASGAPINNAEVYLVPIDPASRLAGPPVWLAVDPKEQPIEYEGLARIAVVSSAGFAECTRSFDGRASHTIKVRIPEATGKAPKRMRFMPRGWYRVGKPEAGAPGFAERLVELAPFWIDKHEVSNAAYMRFCDETGHAWPRIWGEEYDSAWDNLPVIEVSLRDAKAFAEWNGKRLPTDVEWEAAARSPDGRDFPWGDEPPTSAHAVLRDPATRLPGTRAERLRFYLDTVVAVDSIDGYEDTSPNGCLHLYGNVTEWTESMIGGLAGGTTLAIFKGDFWGRSRPDEPAYRLCDYFGALPARPPIGVGFRCVRSAFILEGKE